MRTALLLGFYVVIALLSTDRMALRAEVLAPDNTPCSIDNRPQVSGEQAFSHARRVRLGGKTDADGGRLICWLVIAADKGLPKAQMQLGLLLKDYGKADGHEEEAARLVEKAAGQSDLIAQVILAQLFRDGKGEPQRPNLQNFWMDKALAQVMQMDQLNIQTRQQQSKFLAMLADTAEVSDGLPSAREAEYFKNADAPTRAILCSEGFDRYCVAGNKVGATAGGGSKPPATAANSTGNCSLDNPQNINGNDAFDRAEVLSQQQKSVTDQLAIESLCWYFVSANQGYARSEERLGKIYLNSTVENHFEHAFFWYKRAAQHGDSVAASGLSGMYALGQGVEKSPRFAQMWQGKSFELHLAQRMKESNEASAKAAAAPAVALTAQQRQNQDTVATLLIMLMLASKDNDQPRNVDDDRFNTIRNAERMCSGGNSYSCGQINREPPGSN